MGNLMKSKPKLLGNLGVLPEHFPVYNVYKHTEAQISRKIKHMLSIPWGSAKEIFRIIISKTSENNKSIPT